MASADTHDGQGSVAYRMPNNTFDRTVGSHALATAGQRER
jgi:hypothetical protein